jgi:hypothetical protein
VICALPQWFKNSIETMYSAGGAAVFDSTGKEALYERAFRNATISPKYAVPPSVVSRKDSLVVQLNQADICMCTFNLASIPFEVL